MPDPDTLADMPAAAARLADAVGARRDRSRSSATTTSTARPRRRCSRGTCASAGCAPIIHIPDRLFEGYGPNVEAIRGARRAGRDAAGHGRLRHHQPRAARGSAQARPRRDRDRPSSGRRAAAAGARGGQSQPARRSLGARPSRRGRARVHDRGRAQPRAAPRADSGRRARPSPICSAASISSRSAPSPTWCRSRASTAPSSPRACSRMRRRDNAGLTALMDVARLGGPPEPWHLGFLLGPAHQCRRPHRARRRSASIC